MKNSKILISDSWVRLKRIRRFLVLICLAVLVILAVNTCSTTSNDNMLITTTSNDNMLITYPTSELSQPSSTYSVTVNGQPVVAEKYNSLSYVHSDVITEELDRVKPLIKRLSLSQGACEWAKAVLESPSLKSLSPPAESLTSMENSPFNIAYSVQDIAKIYDTQ